MNIVLAVFTFQDMLRCVIYSKSRCNFQITTGYYVSAKLDQIIFIALKFEYVMFI